MRKHRMIVGVEGPEGAGKTHFGLTAPGPIHYHDIDRGLEGVGDKFPEKDITPFYYRITPPAELAAGSPAIVSHYQRAALQAVEAICQSLQQARSVVVDKADQLWSAILRGHPEEKFETKVAIYQRIFETAYDGNANLILLHGIQVIFSKNKSGQSYPSGDMTCAGWDGTRSAVQLHIATRYSGNGYEFSTQDGRWVLASGGVSQGVFQQTVLKSRDNVQLVGQTFTGMDFPTLAGMAFPNLDWSK